MAKKRRSNLKKETNKKDDKILFAFLAAFLSIIGFIIALIAKRDDRYVMYYAKQSLVIFVIAVILQAISWFFTWIPIIGWIISFAISVVIIIAWLISWIYALSGEEKQIPIISNLAEKFNF